MTVFVSLYGICTVTITTTFKLQCVGNSDAEKYCENYKCDNVAYYEYK